MRKCERFTYSSLVRTSLIVLIIGTLTLYYFFIHSYTNNITYTTFLSTAKLDLTHHAQLNQVETISSSSSSSSFIYSLDSECKFDVNDSVSIQRQKEFNDIFETRRWAPTGSRSGGGSSLEGAHDWIRHLRTLFENYSIRSVADIPCGDTWWQFSLREMNTIENLYFGGDISTYVVKQNQELYGLKHRNKLFQYWDLVQCSIPTYTYKNLTHEIKGNEFDLIIVRDAIQHMNIKNGLKAVRNVIMSGAKFFALSTFPPNERSSASNKRSIQSNESLPLMPVDCNHNNYCSLGNIKDGGLYHNNINCYPFNFPLNKAILVQTSHERFSEDTDEIHIYKIDEELKTIVQQYDKACI